MRLPTQQHRERRGAVLLQLLDAYGSRYSEMLHSASTNAAAPRAQGRAAAAAAGRVRGALQRDAAQRVY